MDSKITELYLKKVLLTEDADEIAALAVEDHDETDMSNPEEQKEVVIGKTILKLIKQCESTPDESYIGTLRKIKAEAAKLVEMHTKQ